MFSVHSTPEDFKNATIRGPSFSNKCLWQGIARLSTIHYPNIANIEQHNSLLTYSVLPFNRIVDSLRIMRLKNAYLSDIGFNQDEIDRIFYSLALPKITCSVSIYGSSPAIIKK